MVDRPPPSPFWFERIRVYPVMGDDQGSVGGPTEGCCLCVWRTEGDDDGSGCGVFEGSLDSWTGCGPGDEGVDQRFVQWTSGFLVGKSWRFCDLGHIRRDPGFLSVWLGWQWWWPWTSYRANDSLKRRFVVVLELIIDIEFSSFFIVSSNWDTWRLLQYVSSVMESIGLVSDS